MTESCYFCNETYCLEEHHIVPDRFGGSDDESNLVSVCPTCHSKLETLYDSEFYEELGVKDEPCKATFSYYVESRYDEWLGEFDKNKSEALNELLSVYYRLAETREITIDEAREEINRITQQGEN